MPSQLALEGGAPPGNGSRAEPRAWAPQPTPGGAHERAIAGTDPSLETADPAVAELIADEIDRQSETICLIPSENYVSRAVLEATGSVLHEQVLRGIRRASATTRASRSSTGSRRWRIERAKALFGVEHANVQPYSGSPANLAVYLAFCKPGDTIMGMALPTGGHLTHGWNVSITGKWFRRGAVRRAPRRPAASTSTRCATLARRERPKLIFCGGDGVSRARSTSRRSREIAERGRRDPRRRHRAHRRADRRRGAPVAGAVTPTWSRRRRTRRCAARAAAMIMCEAEHAAAIDGPCSPGLQGGPHNHTTAGDRGGAQGGARRREFATTRTQIVANAKALGDGARGARLRPRLGRHRQPPDPHRPDEQGRARQARRAGARPRADHRRNYNTVPFDPRKPFDPSGIRLGTPAVTTRGMGEAEMEQIARWIDEGVTRQDGDEGTLERIAEEVRELASAFPIPGSG